MLPWVDVPFETEGAVWLLTVTVLVIWTISSLMEMMYASWVDLMYWTSNFIMDPVSLFSPIIKNSTTSGILADSTTSVKL